jgi:hypothetical protein
MKCRNQRVTRPNCSQKIPHAELHLIRGLVRESNGKETFRTDVLVFDQMCYAIRNDAGFAAACTRKD